MKTGDTVRDGNGRSFQVGQLLGRGLWGKTYTCREEPGGADWVLKVPLARDAFSTDAEQLGRLCREIALEQGRVLDQCNGNGLIRPEVRFTTETGLPVLVLPRMTCSLHARIEAGATLEELLSVLSNVAGQLRGLSGPLTVHGNLRPCNLLSDGRGDWVITDPLTPTLLRHLPVLARARGVAMTWLPPEARTRHEQPLTDGSIDTHALAALMLQAASAPKGTPAGPLPEEGLDKAGLVTLKDAVRNRLGDEPGNQRFHARFSDRLGTLLNRALSRETSPSPPYRFPRLDEFQGRVNELAALVNPRVTHVGRVLFDRPPGSTSFTTEEELAFSCSVGCSAGVENHEDIGCGLAVFDLDKDKRLRDVPCSYTVDRHPSGRFRFGFRVRNMPPAAYRVRIAFTIRDSGGEPVTAEGELNVHPAAGYMPPRTAPQPKAIQFAPRAEPETVTEVGKGPANRPPSISTPAAVGMTASMGSGGPAMMSSGGGSAAVAMATHSAAVASHSQVQRPEEIPEPNFGPKPIAPPLTELAPPAQATPPVPDEPQYQGAGRWTDLPLPGTGGPSPIGPDRFADDLTEPYDLPLRPGPFDRLMELTQGDTYRLFIGGAVVVIVMLVLALLALR